MEAINRVDESGKEAYDKAIKDILNERLQESCLVAAVGGFGLPMWLGRRAGESRWVDKAPSLDWIPRRSLGSGGW